MIEVRNNLERGHCTVCSETRASCDTQVGFLMDSGTTGSLLSMMKIIACLISLCHHLMTKSKITKEGEFSVGGNNDTEADLCHLPPKPTKIYQYNFKMYHYYKTPYDSNFPNESVIEKD